MFLNIVNISHDKYSSIYNTYTYIQIKIKLYIHKYIHISKIFLWKIFAYMLYTYIYNNNNNTQNLGMTMVNEEALCLSSRLPISLSYRTIMRIKL